MLTTLRGLVLILALILGVSSSFGQRPDSSGYVYGRLVEVTETAIQYVDYMSPLGVIASTPRTSATEAFGCTFDKVKPGVNFLMELAEANGSVSAASVYFEACAPFLHFSGNVAERTGNTIVLENVQGADTRDRATVVLSDESLIYDCQGRPATADDIRVGDLIAVSVVDNDGTYDVTTMSINERCPEYRSEQLVFVELTDDGARFTQPDGSTIELSFENGPRDPNFPDSLQGGFIYTCTGEFLTWDDIRAGQVLRVTYLDNAESTDYLIEAFVEEGCPQHVGGEIVALTSTTVDIREPNGVVATYTFAPTTEFWSCRGSALTKDDLRVGRFVKGAWLEDGDRRSLMYLQVTDGCSFAFAEAGIITEITDSTIAIRSMNTGADIYLRIDEQSLGLDCSGSIREISAFLSGDTVTVFYRVENDAAYLDLLQSMQSCEQLRVHGTVAAVGQDRLVVTTEVGPQTLLVDAKTQLYDCAGGTLVLSQDLVGVEIGAQLNGRDSLRTIEYAWLNVGCVTEVLLSGTIVSYENGVLTIASQGKQDSVFLADFSLVIDANGMIADRTDLTVGRMVCVLMHLESGASPVAMHVILDTDCSGRGPEAGIRVKGEIVSRHDGAVTLDVEGKSVKVAVLGLTNIQHQQYGTVGMDAITAGATAMVSMGRHLADGTPVAESILLMDGTTSVDEESDASAMVVSPNPVRDRFTLVGLPGAAARLEIVDMQGRNVLTLNEPASSVDCSALTQGAYIARVTLANGTVLTAPMLIAR